MLTFRSKYLSWTPLRSGSTNLTSSLLIKFQLNAVWKMALSGQASSQCAEGRQVESRTTVTNQSWR